MLLRKATPRDIPVIKHLAHTTWRPTYGTILTEAQTEYMLEMMYSGPALEEQMLDGHCFLIMEEGNVPLAFASYELNHKGAAGVCKLHKLYLLPQTQGRGIGRALLEEVVKQAQEAGQKKMLLHVNRHNPAREFYRHFGFAVIAEEDIDIGGGYFMNDYLMSYRLT